MWLELLTEIINKLFDMLDDCEFANAKRVATGRGFRARRLRAKAMKDVIGSLTSEQQDCCASEGRGDIRSFVAHGISEDEFDLYRGDA